MLDSLYGNLLGHELCKDCQEMLMDIDGPFDVQQVVRPDVIVTVAEYGV